MVTRFLLILLSAVLALPAQAGAAPRPWLHSLSFPQDMRISAPASLTIDNARQRYYIVDSREKRLVSFDQHGVKLKEFYASAALHNPVALAFASPGKMWIIERNSNELLYLDLESEKIRRFDLNQTTGEVFFAHRIASDAQQRVYVSNSHDGRIVRLDDHLKIDAIFCAQPDSRLIDFKIKDSSLYALDHRHHQLLRFTLDGQCQEIVTLKGLLDFPVSFEIDTDGTIYVLDRALARVSVFNRQGDYRYYFAQRGYRRGQLHYPSQLVFDWRQRLCIVNQGNDRIEVFSR